MLNGKHIQPLESKHPLPILKVSKSHFFNNLIIRRFIHLTIPLINKENIFLILILLQTERNHLSFIFSLHLFRNINTIYRYYFPILNNFFQIFNLKIVYIPLFFTNQYRTILLRIPNKLHQRSTPILKQHLPLQTNNLNTISKRNNQQTIIIIRFSIFNDPYSFQSLFDIFQLDRFLCRFRVK